MSKKLAFIGAGSMAEAIISGIVKAQILKKGKIVATNKSNRERLERLEQKYQIQPLMDKEAVILNTDIIILSTKPCDLKDAVESIKMYVKPNQLIISVIAGVSTEHISDLIGNDAPVVRAMPNTSATISHSATAISAGKYATDEHLGEAEELFNTIGTTTIVNEADMHTVTGISGSGPAYIYYLVEAMEKAAVDAGLDKSTAMDLITQTVVGAGEMLKQSGESAAELRKKITSPAGTTHAGIEVLEGHDFQQIIMECVQSARERSIELGNMD
ncbi:pyrroline-5-carboxylate reductase [Virgibacillus halotolerans]|uniref:pyrroline-5-carboxylate reductase n=1 Tax=Virgibacillus halotolerans TaxID=1071053 RepID=UPI00195FFC3A|nr:pyrroline-5-carboxylate reductase [Virgibacillus halotolerans]MBM7601340.1 pyrroline-5-carboxylate reductase [Virgibacillus halotolerans]